MANKTRYNDEELEEFRHVINEKLKLARRDYEAMMRTLMNADGNDVDDTSYSWLIGSRSLLPGLKPPLCELPTKPMVLTA